MTQHSVCNRQARFRLAIKSGGSAESIAPTFAMFTPWKFGLLVTSAMAQVAPVRFLMGGYQSETAVFEYDPYANALDIISTSDGGTSENKAWMNRHPVNPRTCVFQPATGFFVYQTHPLFLQTSWLPAMITRWLIPLGTCKPFPWTPCRGASHSLTKSTVEVTRP